MNILYKLSFEWNTLCTVTIIFILVIGIQFIILQCYKLPEPDYKNIIPGIDKVILPRSIRKGNVIFGIIFTIILFSLFLFKVGGNYVYIYSKFYLNRYSVTTGKVYNFEEIPKHSAEKFYINDIEFIYSKNLKYGYNKIKNEGSVITGNGQNLKIGYIEYKGLNIIVYIEQV